jgi:siroheme synthase
MHAVVVDVRIEDVEASQAGLRDEVVPSVSSAPGFVAGYWIHLGDGHGHSVAVFESEEAAKAAAERVSPPSGAPVSIENVQVGEVVASA